MKNSIILSSELIFFVFVFLQKLWQSICSYIYLVLLIINLQVVLNEFLSLTNLFKTQILYIYKTVKVIVIYED